MMVGHKSWICAFIIYKGFTTLFSLMRHCPWFIANKSLFISVINVEYLEVCCMSWLTTSPSIPYPISCSYVQVFLCIANIGCVPNSSVWQKSCSVMAVWKTWKDILCGSVQIEVLAEKRTSYFCTGLSHSLASHSLMLISGQLFSRSCVKYVLLFFNQARLTCVWPDHAWLGIVWQQDA